MWHWILFSFELIFFSSAMLCVSCCRWMKQSNCWCHLLFLLLSKNVLIFFLPFDLCVFNIFSLVFVCLWILLFVCFCRFFFFCSCLAYCISLASRYSKSCSQSQWITISLCSSQYTQVHKWKTSIVDSSFDEHAVKDLNIAITIGLSMTRDVKWAKQ